MSKPTISLLYEIVVRDTKTGKVVSRKKGKSKSFVLQFLQLIYTCFNVNVLPTIKDISNTNRTVSGDTPEANGGIGNANLGIVVGSGTTAVANTDYKLVTQIAHGVGAGQLSYGIQSFVAAAVVGANVDFVLTRTFANTSGNPVTINEIGLYAIMIAQAWYFCIIRDLATQIVNNLQTATVTYTLRTTA